LKAKFVGGLNMGECDYTGYDKNAENEKEQE
jgi:hypothetical protein